MGQVSSASASASASNRRLQHTRGRVQWQWKANVNPWSSSEREEWKNYSDVETCIIEEAYQAGKNEVLLDNYHVVFKPHLIQINNNNHQNQRPVKRLNMNESEETRLREERFMPTPAHPSCAFSNIYDKSFIDAVIKYFNIDYSCPAEQPSMLVVKAAEGIIIEGKKLGQQKEAEWMAQQLMKVKKGSKEEIYATLARLYTMESFLYKNLNAIMRLVGDSNQAHYDLWNSKVPTWGPFAWLLWSTLTRNSPTKLTVYRGANLSDNLIKQYKENPAPTGYSPRDYYDFFPAFTSTSLSREKAEQFGNALFIIEINENGGSDVSIYSDYPHEQEILLSANFQFYIQSREFDKTKGKWIIHLKQH